MMLPTVHLNGTSHNALLTAAYDALDALNVAVTKLRETAPNGRDYYPQGNSAIYEAQEEYIVRLNSLLRVLADVQTLVEHLEKNDPDPAGL